MGRLATASDKLLIYSDHRCASGEHRVGDNKCFTLKAWAGDILKGDGKVGLGKSLTIGRDKGVLVARTILSVGRFTIAVPKGVVTALGA